MTFVGKAQNIDQKNFMYTMFCKIVVCILFHALLYSEEDCSQSLLVDIEDSNRKRRKVVSDEKAKVIVSKVHVCA